MDCPENATHAAILLKSEEGDSAEVPVDERITIGRAPENEVSVSHASVSRQHAEIRRCADGHYRVSDLDSLNGTFLNGKRATRPRELYHGDEIRVGDILVVFLHPDGPERPAAPDSIATPLHFARMRGDLRAAKHAVAAVLVCDVHGYASLTEKLPAEPFRAFISDWFRDARVHVQDAGGMLDALVADGIVAYWLVANDAGPVEEINGAVRAAIRLVQLSLDYARRFSAEFEVGEFAVGVGVHLGGVSVGRPDVGAAAGDDSAASGAPSIIGEAVVVASHLESLAREKRRALLTSWDVVQWASADLGFHNLGQTRVEGLESPVSVLAADIPD